MNSDRVVYIKLDQERPMLLSLMAMRKFHEITGINLLGRFNIAELAPDQLAWLLWACLNVRQIGGRWENDYGEPFVLTVDQVSNLINFKDLLPVYLAVAQLVKNDMPDPKEPTDPKA